jgi:tetratricopeptide (TPR) repeat protein
VSSEAQMQLQGFSLAEHWLQVGQPQRALDVLSTADIEDPHTWRLRAIAFHDLDQHPQCIAAAEAGLATEPEDTLLLRLLAASQRECGDLAAAERAVLAGLEVNPEDSSLLCEYARILMDANQVPKAREVIAHAGRVAPPDDIELLFTRAQLAWIENRRADGLRDVERILQLDSQNPYAQALIGSFKSERAWPTEWARHLEDAAREDPSDADLVEAAREARLVSHPAMVPLWPIHRFGWVAVTVTGVVAAQIGRYTIGGTPGAIVAFTWFTYCVYSWVTPFLLRRWMNRRWA